MESSSTNKRTKSVMNRGKSLLQRVSSRTDVHEAEDEGSASVSSSSLASSAPTSAPSQQPRTSQTSQTSRHRPHLSTTMNSSSAVDIPPGRTEGDLSPPSPSGTSIADSVKLFRLFEALRSGDTAAISRAMKADSDLEGTTVLHLAIQCAENPVISYVLSNASSAASGNINVNARDKDGNTPLHVAAMLSRASIVRTLLEQQGINDSLPNYQGKTPLDLARSPEIFQQLQLTRSLFVDEVVKQIHSLIAKSDYKGLEKLLTDQKVRTTLDVNDSELATDPATVEAGGTLLHDAARKKDTKLIQLLLLNGADPFKRDRKGKLPQDVTKDDSTRAILKKSPAAKAAQTRIQEKTILGGSASQQAVSPAGAESSLGSKEGREMKGYLKKWTNYTGGYKLRWFVLEDGVLSYYKHQDDAGSACRGAINMKIAKLNMDPQDKLRFEILGKSSVKYHLKANHQVEAKRWFWALNNAIQWTKDEAKEEQRRHNRETEVLRQARTEQLEKQSTRDGDSSSLHSQRASGKPFTASTALGVPLTSGLGSSHAGTRESHADLIADAARSVNSMTDDDRADSNYEPSQAGNDLRKLVSQVGTTTIEGDMDDDDEEYGDDASSHEAQPTSKDAFTIAAQSAKLQLDLLEQVVGALQAEKKKNPSLQLADPISEQALSSYEAAVSNLKSLVQDLLRISRDRDAYWQYRLDREENVRRMWEESMARVAREQEELETRMGESELKRRATKRALRDALEGRSELGTPGRASTLLAAVEDVEVGKDGQALPTPKGSVSSPVLRRPTFAELEAFSDDESEEEEEFFDAVAEGEVEVMELQPKSPTLPPSGAATSPKAMDDRFTEISKSFKGYEDGIRKRLKLDADNRPRISLWAILKSMIGKDMTKMTLPVSFNEPTSLLYRVAEDMEYTDLIDVAAERTDSTERMLYVAAFAASEYASTIGRVAKPFNPLLGETYEYVRPDKGYRFFIEQVSHHPPVGAAFAESPKWDYYGESAVKSKFYGKSFDINPLGTWFLRLRPTNSPTPGYSELYTWKKVTSSVIGIITGNPTVDNYGLMEIKNWTTGEVCLLDFKPRGWKASSAYQVSGKVLDKDGNTQWSIGGRWNDKIYARRTPGYEGSVTPPGGRKGGKDAAFLVWEANPRPEGIPFNLTPFAVTLNAIPDKLRPVLAPTDTRLRPDQRAMEDGEYDLAATEKNRVEEKQRARRRERENSGEEFVPHWFSKGRCEVTGEEYWVFNRDYWKTREKVANGQTKWKEQGCEDIF